jgi:flagellar biosynthetic protein FliQ
MFEVYVAEIVSEAMYVAALCSAIPLATSLLVGLCISIFQAATQISEQTLSFVPKLLAVVVSLILFGPWLMELLKTLTIHAFESTAYFKIQ